jgi:hypothetical protein
MADEWPLKMDSEREGSSFSILIVAFVLLLAFVFPPFDRIRQPF